MSLVDKLYEGGGAWIQKNWSVLTGLLIASLISLSIQLYFVSDYGSDFSTTPDTMEYLRFAKDLDRFLAPGQETGGHFSYDVAIRTPGYPFTLLLAAKSSGVDISKVQLPLRNIGGTNPEGLTLVRRVVMIQQIVGFLIPVILFLLAFLVTRSTFLAVLSSLAYYFDVISMSYQFVMLTETLSIFALLSAILAFAVALSFRRWYTFLILGLVVTLAISLRPAFGLLTPLMLVTFLILAVVRHPAVSIRSIGVFLAGAFLFPLTWASLNLAINGEFFVTKNQAITIQNFSGRHFVQLELDDPELKILQRHVIMALEEGKHFSIHRSFRPFYSETGKTDRLEYLKLTQRANLLTIRAFPREFLAGGFQRFRQTWTNDFIDPKNPHALDRRAILFGPLEKSDRKMIFGVHTWWVFSGVLLLGISVGLFRDRRPSQAVVLYGFLLLFTHLYMFLTSLSDEIECMRHSMAARTVIHFVLLLVGGHLVQVTIAACKERLGWVTNFTSCRRP